MTQTVHAAGQRGLAAFQAQRRQASVVVRRAGQVNLAHNQQINMSG
jgi:hypothetical protein